MLVVLLLLFGVLALVSFIRVLLFKKEIRTFTQSMKSINPTETNIQLRVGTQNKELVALAMEINALYTLVAKEHADTVVEIAKVQQGMENISHDLRTPLTSIVGYLDILSKDSTLGKEQREYVEISLRKSLSLQKLVQNLFELSRLENGEYPFTIERLNVSTILQEELATFYDMFVKAGIEPEISISDEALWAIGDRQAFSRIFANLLNNMIKHGNGRGIHISAKRENQKIRFLFENEAPDLSDSDIEQIFVRSFTQDRVRNKENTGLGLSITKEFVEQMDGEISAKKVGNLLQLSLCWDEK